MHRDNNGMYLPVVLSKKPGNCVVISTWWIKMKRTAMLLDSFAMIFPFLQGEQRNS